MLLKELLSKNKISKNIDNDYLVYNNITSENRGVHLFSIGAYEVFLFKDAPRQKYNNFTEDVITLWDGTTQIATLLSDIENHDISISSFFLHKNYQGKQIGLNLYKGLIEHNFNIMNHDSQSLGAEKLWAKLSSITNVKVYAVRKNQAFALQNKNGRLTKLDGSSPYVKTDFLIATKKNSETDEMLKKELSIDYS